MVSSAKEVECRWICFETSSLVVENQDAVEGIVEDRFEFMFGGIQSTRCFAVLPTSQNQKSDVERNGRAKSDEDKCKKNRGE